VTGTESAATIQADPVRVEQILWNLVRNALKFTPSGGRVDVSVSHKDGFLCVDVADTGQGIAPDFLPRVFDMFSQADTGAGRERGGLGIGLSPVRQLVEMHGGTIEAHSEGLGTGARFSLRLPEVPHSAHPASRHLQADTSVLRGLRVLLVDDSVEGLEGFRALLELEGAQVRAECNGPNALAAARENEFDLILSDIGMPGMSGYELIAELRKLPGLEAVPAFALTGFGRQSDAEEAMRAGFDAHLRKPVSLHALLGAIACPVGAPLSIGCASSNSLTRLRPAQVEARTARAKPMMRSSRPSRLLSRVATRCS
jgi:two-component system CheB/CheR fusion protein